MDEVERMLREARTIALYDWPGPEMPATLHRAGYLVVGHEPDGAKHYHVSAVSEGPNACPLGDGTFLESSPLERLPENVDIVAAYRPPDEQLGIAREAARLGAKCYWLEPGAGSSEEARSFAMDAGMAFIEGEGLAAAVTRLGVRVSG